MLAAAPTLVRHPVSPPHTSTAAIRAISGRILTQGLPTVLTDASRMPEPHGPDPRHRHWAQARSAALPRCDTLEGAGARLGGAKRGRAVGRAGQPTGAAAGRPVTCSSTWAHQVSRA